jgi:DNA modification methylase
VKPKTRVSQRHGAATKVASCGSITSSSFDKHADTSTQPRAAHDQPVRDKAAGGVAVIYRRIDELRLNPKNPRLHSARQIRQIARSIEAFGFNVPVLVDAHFEVIAGHGRVMAARLLGWNEVPIIRLDHLSEDQAKAFMIADNRLTENSLWDERILAEQLKELSVLELDFSLEVTGFEMGEIDLRIDGLTADGEDRAALEEAPSTLPAGPSVTRVGDLWLLGAHRVLCGNALDQAAYAGLMQDDRAQMVFVDPPYNVPIEGNVSGLGAVHHREFMMASGEMNEAEFTSFLAEAFSLLIRSSAEGSLHFVCMDWRHLAELLAAGRQVYGELKNLCVWAKDNAGMGSLYRSQHELVFVFKQRGQAHRNNIQLGQYGRNRSNVWHYPGANSFSRSNDEGNLLALHPTGKPVALVADAILDCTARRDIVLDSFLGSGTTVIAAQRSGRRCYGLELDPLYVDTIVRRWQAFTQQDAHLESSGRSFNQIARKVEESGGGQDDQQLRNGLR